MMLESKKLNPSRNGAANCSGSPQPTVNSETQTVGRANEILDGLQDVIRRYPAVSLGVAVATGLAIGWLVKRR